MFFSAKSVDPQQILVPGIPIAEFHGIHVSLFLLPVQVLLGGSMTLCCISHSSRLYIISKLADGTLCLIIQVINEDVEQYWT